MAYTHILFTGTPTQNILAVVSATVGTMAFSIVSTAFFVTRMTIVEFLLLAFATVLAFIPLPLTMTAAIGIFTAVYFYQRRRVSMQLGANPAAETITK
jgi:TRAP-type uncharacterized transport system fused permease subunit